MGWPLATLGRSRAPAGKCNLPVGDTRKRLSAKRRETYIHRVITVEVRCEWRARASERRKAVLAVSARVSVSFVIQLACYFGRKGGFPS